MASTPKTPDDYISRHPQHAQDWLNRLRTIAKDAVPNATEGISYGVPAFRDGKVFAYIGAFKRHIGLYPPLEDEPLPDAIAPFANDRGNLAFPFHADITDADLAAVFQALHRQATKD